MENLIHSTCKYSSSTSNFSVSENCSPFLYYVISKKSNLASRINASYLLMGNRNSEMIYRRIPLCHARQLASQMSYTFTSTHSYHFKNRANKSIFTNWNQVSSHLLFLCALAVQPRFQGAVKPSVHNVFACHWFQQSHHVIMFVRKTVLNEELNTDSLSLNFEYF